MGRGRRAVIAVVVAGALFAPVALDHDSFPLATYPMYAGARGREITFATAVGVDRQGRTHRLSPQVIGGIDDPLIVVSELRNAIADDRVPALCAGIAKRASRREVTAIEVVTERHDVVDQVRGRSSLLARTVHGRCEVDR